MHPPEPALPPGERYKSSRATVFAEFSGLHGVRITVALMMVAERRLRFLDVTGPG